jgi:hypothetical protein
MLANGVNRLLRWVLVGGIGLAVIAVVFLLLVNKQQNKQFTQNEVVNAEVVGRDSNPVGSKAKFLIPEDRVPRSYKESQDAAAIELIPGRWQADPESNGILSGPSADKDSVPADERKAIARTVDGFLKNWETYYPGSWQDFARYKDSFAPYAVADAINSLGDRVDNHQPPRVCPRPTCTVGSEWDFPQTYDAMTVRSFEGDKAWVTTAGPVILRAFSDEDPFTNTRYLRSYGILLEKQGSRWLVTRAAADTVDTVN